MSTPIEDLSAIVEDEAFGRIADALAAQRANWIDNDFIFQHVKALAEIMPRLKDFVVSMNPPAPAATPST